jgi:16S rRNA processing protein RimM
VLHIYREDTDPDIIFAAELIGMDVFCEEEQIGKIVEVLDYPGNKVYVVKGEKEYMIPAVKAFVLSTDMDANRMQVRLIEGMATGEN